MAFLVPSLKLLFREFDTRWPHRDRRTDGWICGPGNCLGGGHTPDGAGRIHAIDVDVDGIDPQWTVNNIYHDRSVLWFVVWSRRIWSNTYGFVPRTYTGSNPHTDHMHIEIYRTDVARNYSRGWGIAPASSGFGPAPGTGGFGASWDSSPLATVTAGHFEAVAVDLHTVSNHLVRIR